MKYKIHIFLKSYSYSGSSLLLVRMQSEIEYSEIDCQSEAYRSTYDGVGNRLLSLEQAQLAEHL